MEIRETSRGIEVSTPVYCLLLEREGGFAVREVNVHGEGRLDRFDRPGEGPHPTCMHFDNLTINYQFQLAHYGKPNTAVEATIDGSAVRLTGQLMPIVDDANGNVHIAKNMQFGDDFYDVDLTVNFHEMGSINYASVWWDVNDKWLRAMRSSAGVFMPLRVGIGDSFGEHLGESWRSMTAMERGVGVWMEMLGERVAIMAALRSPAPSSFVAGGMKYWDGPDDADEGEGVSHGCINLDLINCELSGTPAHDIQDLAVAYRVFVSGPTILRKEA